jgi:hypothetical protein
MHALSCSFSFYAARGGSDHILPTPFADPFCRVTQTAQGRCNDGEPQSLRKPEVPASLAKGQGRGRGQGTGMLDLPPKRAARRKTEVRVNRGPLRLETALAGAKGDYS